MSGFQKLILASGLSGLTVFLFFIGISPVIHLDSKTESGTAIFFLTWIIGTFVYLKVIGLLSKN